MVAIEGVDYAFGGPLSSAALKANGKAFAGRYVVDDKSPAGRGITAAEYRELTNGGVDVFVYWEAAESWMLRGWNAGVAAAQNAQANILAAGMPANVPVYFACDFDAQAPEMPAIDDCL